MRTVKDRGVARGWVSSGATKETGTAANRSRREISCVIFMPSGVEYRIARRAHEISRPVGCLRRHIDVVVVIVIDDSRRAVAELSNPGNAPAARRQGEPDGAGAADRRRQT